MIISNDSKNIVVKYISVLLNETFDSTQAIVSRYKNNIYNDFNIGDRCVVSNLIGYGENNTYPQDKFLYCKVDYVGGTIINIIKDESTLKTERELRRIPNTTRYGTDSLARKKRLLYVVQTDNDCYGKALKVRYRNHLLGLTSTSLEPLNEVELNKLDAFLNSDKIGSTELLNEINNNDEFFEDEYSEHIFIPAGSTILARKSTTKRADDLCAMIAMYLNSRYPILINSDMDYDINEILNSDICRYFTSRDTTFNADKLCFDFDDFITSFLLGRSIGPMSPMEDIEYVQRLLESSLYVNYTHEVYGEWDDNLTISLYNYQQRLNKRFETKLNIRDDTDNVYLQKNNSLEKDQFINYNMVIPTGYFDIITEKYLLQDKMMLGDEFNNAYSSI